MDNFEDIAEHTVLDLYHQTEDRLSDSAEIDYDDGILTIVMDGIGTYLINRHAPTKQIWLSSPKSGAWHFAAAEIGDTNRIDWISTRGQKQSLYDILNAELSPVLAFQRPARP